ncbi:MAG: molybdenum cofactor biosynthesis protein, partial [Deltaproteobacteria bacterium]
VIEREIPGFSELMRRKSEEKTRFAPFSRGVCGIARRTLVVNLPGSPRGAVENLDFLFPLIPEAVRMIKGKVDDCASHRE